MRKIVIIIKNIAILVIEKSGKILDADTSKVVYKMIEEFEKFMNIYKDIPMNDFQFCCENI